MVRFSVSWWRPDAWEQIHPDGRDSGGALVVVFAEVGVLLDGAWGIVLSWRDEFDTVEPTRERRDEGD